MNVQNPQPDLRGRNVIVTGAAQGIGRAIAQLVLESGGNVTAVDLNEQAIGALAAESGSDRLLALAGSVADASFAPTVVEQSVDRFGAVHGGPAAQAPMGCTPNR